MYMDHGSVAMVYGSRYQVKRVDMIESLIVCCCPRGYIQAHMRERLGVQDKSY